MKALFGLLELNKRGDEKMQFKAKTMMIALGFACFLLSEKVYASEVWNTEIPLIKSWENGNGYTEDGAMITGTWAFDSVNPAGSYVLFGDDGSVLRKTDQWDSREDTNENFTGTEQEPSAIAVRVKTFPEFSGVVNVTLEGKSGIKKTYELNQNNQYECNLKVNSGEYALKEVNAHDTDYTYEVVFSPAWNQVEEKGIVIMQIQVTEEKSRITEKIEQSSVEETELSSGNEQKKIHTSIENDEVIESTEKKILLLVGGVTVTLVAGYLLLRNKKNKYQ